MEDFFWLNDDSRTFLSRGYIDGDKTAERRISDIAEAAADILNDYDFADKFYNYMARGYFLFQVLCGLTLVQQKVYLSHVMEFT